ncbi:hypothetical protein BUALT_Bualt07G0141900 [Buddleja alternifolia]|uniref:DUF4283 domain-containing protein n=1 Tax=Buddleja alternifolia TaxID=168488 RepID=A0AAV6XF23_9LAMI|nr:hypothetical protein BUALT_Bualt07G0141900 [Buddleja alternifolia]
MENPRQSDEEEILRMEELLSLAAKEDKEMEIPQNVWQSGQNVTGHMVIGRLVTSRKFSFAALRSTLITVFNTVRKVDIMNLDDNPFLVTFDHVRDRDRVLDEGPWSFVNNLVVLRHLRDIPRKGSGWSSFLRLKACIDITKPLRRSFNLKSPSGNVFKLSVAYERLPNFCYFCRVLGHTEKNCGLRYNDNFVDPGLPFPFSPKLRATPRRQSFFTSSGTHSSSSGSNGNENCGGSSSGRRHSPAKSDGRNLSESFLRENPRESSRVSASPGFEPFVVPPRSRSLYLVDEEDSGESPLTGNLEALAPNSLPSLSNIATGRYIPPNQRTPLMSSARSLHNSPLLTPNTFLTATQIEW